MLYPDVMVDIETTGLNPDEAAIIQIAAVRFNLEEQTIDPEVFDRCLRIPVKRFWDEETRRWWFSQNRSVLQDIHDRMEDPAVVVQSFSEWSRAKQQGQKLHFWGKPISFDYAFMSSYFRQFGVDNPYHYREAIDMNSYIKGLGRSSTQQEFDIVFQGNAHNALVDALNQIKYLFEAQKNVRPGG